MVQKINRRSLLKSGFASMGALAVAPFLTEGAFASTPMRLDKLNRIFYSPMVRGHFLDQEPDLAKMVARIGSNENPYGPPPMARKAIAESIEKGNRYARTELKALTDKIAAKEGVSGDYIMMGNGSGDLLEKTALAVFKDGGNLVSADPTYMSLIRVAESIGATWKPVPCKADWSHDLDAMEKAIDKDTKLVYICNPNNPVGAVTSTKALTDFCSRVSEKVPIFIDEAYIELVEGADNKSMVSLLKENKNVIIARTFSKIMGMAGLRVGYITAMPATLDMIKKTAKGGGSGIACTSVYAASAAMDDVEFQNNTRKLNTEAKNYLYENLKTMGYQYVPSFTNFVIFPINMPGKEFLKKMVDKGIVIKAMDIREKPWCRVSIGTKDEMKLFVSALQEMS
ncbi:pyridoxal phosphate-dependent aminotransferase [Dyadobacter fanqingshengii]|uniref:Histidinol-phosphate aminotransferase family protein n=1 Tax=Dyadobacter fanqingshengii TaxID=2906443 RepID=A0A9X1PBD4_9BACT|nr:histidinol-phosphate transaminase [Dyadobacter fanqingshengii]MCF0040152.1 histidinol-phosphate aminotransferase family protein [Dyadobacter fanqingshengii]USJ38096.1 histidinol-phosphate aminotransferase family protein [Dyadobacter fanqingshengii]